MTWCSLNNLKIVNNIAAQSNEIIKHLVFHMLLEENVFLQDGISDTDLAGN